MRELDGRWNLPGGHLEAHEPLIAGAKREAREETGLNVEPDYLIGIYTGYGKTHLINFVFHAVSDAGIPTGQPGEVAGLMWQTPASILELPAENVLNPRKMRRIIEGYLGGRVLPLEAITEDVYGA